MTELEPDLVSSSTEVRPARASKRGLADIHSRRVVGFSHRYGVRGRKDGGERSKALGASELLGGQHGCLGPLSLVS